ncbi:hypothetical protein QEN19_004033 [Hanseniaspora menglaensis]
MSSTRPDLKFIDTSSEANFFKKASKTLGEDKDPAINKVFKICDSQKDYFIAMNSFCDLVCQLIYKTTSIMKTRSDSQRYVTVSMKNFQNLMKMLLNLGFKIEIYDFDWKLNTSCTIGTVHLLEEKYGLGSEDQLVQTGNSSLRSDEVNVVVMALKIENGSNDNVNIGTFNIGCSFIDYTSDILGYTQFDEVIFFNNLETVLVQLGVKELIVPDNLLQVIKNDNFVKIIEKCNCLLTPITKNAFNFNEYESQSLKECILEENKDTLLALNNHKYSELILSTFQALLQYMKLENNSTNQYKKYYLMEYGLNQYMKIDQATTNSLNMFPEDNIDEIFGNESSSIVSSLYQLLNKNITIQGSRLLKTWLKQPLLDQSKVQERLDIVEFFVDNVEVKNSLRANLFSKLNDLFKIFKKLARYNNAEISLAQIDPVMDDILKIYNYVNVMPEILNVLNESISDENEDEETSASSGKDLIFSKFVKPMTQLMNPLNNLIELINSTIDIPHFNETNQVSFLMLDEDSELKTLQDKIDTLKVQISNIHASVGKTLNVELDKKLKLETQHQVYGYCLRLSRNEGKILRNYSKKEFIELSTLKAGIYFTTPELQQISGNIAKLEMQFKENQVIIITEILKVVTTYYTPLMKLQHLMGELDLLNTFAVVSTDQPPIPYTKPLLSSNLETKILKARHPLLEMNEQNRVIPNDVYFNSSSKCKILTGPNMGGKSTYLRTIATCQLLTQIGCFIPADAFSEVNLVDGIFSRIGSGDCQYLGLSTFMVEMLQISSILKTASENSLVLVDELGRGTSTYDGFAIASGILTKLKSIGCECIFATHFHELSDTDPEIENLKMLAHSKKEKDAKQNEITLLYKVGKGKSGESFGINVLEYVGFSPKIINIAKRKLQELEDEESQEYNTEGGKKFSKEEVVTILQKWKQDLSGKELTREIAEKLMQDVSENL